MNAAERELYEYLDRQPDIGVSKILSNWAFEPPNSFDTKPRTKLKTEILIVLSYLFLMGATFVVFNGLS